MPDSTIGSIGSAYFLGFAVSSGKTPALADQYGRKKPYLTSLIVQTISYVFIICASNVNMVIIYYFIVGLCAGGRVAIGTMYMAEFIPEKQQDLVVSQVNVGDAIIMMLQCLYYNHKNEWLPLHIFQAHLHVLIIILIYMYIPESPKWLYANRRYDEARETLKVVAKYNKANITDS